MVRPMRLNRPHFEIAETKLTAWRMKGHIRPPRILVQGIGKSS
jgi:hypothetical protein